MKFVCERCHTKYSIADEKVRGKVLKVRCKTCANVITVRETGATIDDMGPGAGPREAPIARSGSFDAGQAAATVVAPQDARVSQRAALPPAALVAPGAPAAAPPPRRPTPPPAPADNVEWYLAVDGAQTGPFPRSRLIDKVLATPKDADVHIWNADLDAWKPPKDVPEIQADLTHRRSRPTPAPPPPLRRPSGSLPLAAAPDGRSGASAAGGLGLAAVDAGPDLAKLPPPGTKKNGVGSAVAAAAGAAPGGAAQSPHNNFGLGDLLGGEPDMGATPAPASARGVAAKTLDPLTLLTPPPVLAHAPVAPVGAGVFGAPTAKAIGKAIGKDRGKEGGKQVRLLVAGLAVVVVLCGIVALWMFRRPGSTSSSVAGTAPTGPVATDFAGMAEKLAQEEQAAKALAKLTAPAPPLVVETKPLVAQVEPPQKAQKGGKGKRKNQLTAPPPLVGASGAPLTAEQRAAANRFGESTGRDVRLPTATAGGARATPAQADISRVINNNRQGIQTCYQRALLRDNTLTHGKVTVRVSIGLSGKVKSVSLDAPAQFRALEPCIRDVMSRWAFPPSSEEYGTEFPVVLQGNQ